MVSRVTQDPRTANLEITYVDEGNRIQSEEFDLVILSVGLVSHPAPGIWLPCAALPRTDGGLP